MSVNFRRRVFVCNEVNSTHPDQARTMSFTIEIHDQAVRDALQALGKRVANMAPIQLAVGENIHGRTDARFTSSTGPDGLPWKPKQKPNGYKTLVGKTGDQRRQIVSGVTGNTLTVQATARYAAIHQFSGSIPRQAGQITTRPRTDAKGSLLRSAIMNGKGLIRQVIPCPKASMTCRSKAIRATKSWAQRGLNILA